MPVAGFALSLAACGGGSGGTPTVSYALTVLKSGTGSGAVTGGGISCGATCSASLSYGTAVTLTATADVGSTFEGWMGCDSAVGATCNLTLNGDRTVTASFGPVQQTLTVVKSGAGTGTVTGGGINCGATCSASLSYGTAVTLTATAEAGSTFGGWSGCDSTSGTTCNVTLNAGRTVIATFSPLYTLTVLKSGTGSGTVTGGGISCGATCSASLAFGTAVTLAAAADAGSTFVAWSGCDSASGTACNLTMNADRAATATFTLNQDTGSLHVVNSTSYTIAELHVSPAGAGTWGPNQLASPIPPSGTFTLAGIPAGTYDFRAVASDGLTYWQTNAVSITAGGQSTWTLLPPAVGSLSVVNNTTSYTIAELYVSAAGAGTWGSNQLAFPILAGGTFTLADIPVGSHDFLAIASDGYSHWRMDSASITAGGLLTWTLLPPATGSLSVTNFHCVAVAGLFLTPSTAPTLSPNQLVAPLDPLAAFTLTGIPVGTYDVSAVGIDGTSWAINGVAIAAGGTQPWNLYMPAGTGCLTVINNTAADTINFLFDPPSPSGCTGNNWGTEQLGQVGGAPVLPGSSFTLTNVPAGAHDLRALGNSPLGPVEHLACGMGIPPGGTFLWYLVL